MHMHAHIKDCVIDYGPPHTFWAFAFERYNGILGEQPNNTSVELQLAKRFVCDNRQLLTSLPETYKDQFSPIFESSRHFVGTLRDFSPIVSTPSQTTTDWSINGIAAEVPKNFSRGVFSLNQTNGLEELCSLYSVSSSSIIMTSSFHKYKEITLYGKQLGSYRSRSSSSSTVMAAWNLTNEEAVHPARINYFAEHSLITRG